MILILIDYLREAWNLKIPAVFCYYSTRMILAALTTLIISIFCGPRFITKLYELKIGQPVRMEDCPLLGELHRKKQDTPTMGGILILFAMLIAMFLWMDLKHVFTLFLFLTTIVLGALGGYDDYLKLRYKNTKGLSGKKKLAIQCTLSLLLGLYLFIPSASQAISFGTWYRPPTVKEEVVVKKKHESRTLPMQEYASRLYVPFMKDPLLKFSGIFTIFAIMFVILVITGSSNAVNLTDGLDGLAAGCLIMVAASLAFIAFVSNHSEIAAYLNILYIEGSGEIAIYLMAFVGACLGFLWYNGHPAQLFMGDTGSLALGGIIGVAAVLLKRELLLAVVGGVFVAEAMSVILQVGSYKLRNKKRIFLIAPLHHHFEYKGWAETKVVIRFWIVSLLLSLIGIASLKFQ